MYFANLIFIAMLLFLNMLVACFNVPHEGHLGPLVGYIYGIAGLVILIILGLFNLALYSFPNIQIAKFNSYIVILFFVFCFFDVLSISRNYKGDATFKGDIMWLSISYAILILLTFFYPLAFKEKDE